MIKVTVGNSVSKVEGMDKGQESALRELLSYQVDANAAYFSGAYKRHRRYLIDAKGQFPTGLLKRVYQYLDNELVFGSNSVEARDTRVRPKSPRTLYHLSNAPKPYPAQVKALGEAIRASRGIVSAVTGSGKSLLAAMIVDKLQLRTLIVVPNLGLKQQLRESFTGWFGKHSVGGLGKDIAIENVDALDPDEVITGYDCVIIDEAHHAAAKTYRKLNLKSWYNIYHRYFLTATPFRSRDEEQILLESVTGDVITEITYHDAVKAKTIVHVEAYYYELPKIACSGHTWSQVYSELVVNRVDRLQLIAGLLESLRASYVPTLCLVKEIKHGENIQKFVPYIPFIKGENDDNADQLREFNNGKQTSLIGTTGVLGEGIDTKPAEYVIIAGLGKSKNQFMQQVGRGLRRHSNKECCKIILFYDPSHRWSKAHFKAQKKFLLDEYNVIPVKLNL